MASSVTILQNQQTIESITIKIQAPLEQAHPTVPFSSAETEVPQPSPREPAARGVGQRSTSCAYLPPGAGSGRAEPGRAGSGQVGPASEPP